MKFFKNRFRLAVVGYLLFPLLSFWFLTKSWIPEGFILAGHDSGLALDARQFLESRFFAWDPHINFGQDNALNFGSITLHLFDYFFAILSGNQAAGNQLSIFFWVSLIFCAAVVLSLTLKEYFGRVFVFIFPPLITFNFYVFQSMFMLERAKYGLLAATMIFLTLAIRVIEKKMNILFAASLSSLTFLLFNGGSLWGLPLYGGLLIIIVVLFFHTLVSSISTRNFGELRRFTFFLILSGIGYLLINSYAIFPSVIKFIRGSSSELFSQESIAPNKVWLNYISQSSSFLNILRLEGIPDWYNSQYEVNRNHPYAEKYTQNNFLISASFIFPVLAFLSLTLIRTPIQKKLVSLFALTAVISVVFVAGTHPPLGFIYDFLYDTIPGFTIFRTPFYKFGSAFFLAMMILISFTLSVLIGKLFETINKIFVAKKIKVIVDIVSISTVILIWLTFHSALLSPQILYWQKTSTTKIEVPNYVKEFKSWVENNDIDNRILLLPPLDEGWRVDSYNWGYWSLSTLPSMLIFENSVANDVSLTAEEKGWLWEMYTSLKEGKEDESILLARRLGIGYFLIRNDVSLGDKLFSLEEPSKFEGALRSFGSVSPVASFGSWIVFKVSEPKSPEIYPVSSAVQLPQNQLFLYRDFAKNETTILKKKEHDKITFPNDLISTELKSYPCVSCLIEEVETNTVLPTVTVLPNSPLYVIKKIREKSDITSAKNDSEKINAYLGSIVRRSGEVKNMLDARAREKYLLDELKIINEYLLILHDLVSSNLSYEEEFQQAKRLLLILNPVEANLRIEVDKAKSGTFGEGVVQAMIDALWQIHRIKILYSGVLNNEEKWTGEKVFNISLGPGDPEIFIGTSFLPFDNDGKRILPSEVFLTHDPEKIPLKITPYSDNVARLVPGKPITGDFRLSLVFSNVPNKFNFQEFKTVESPRGPIGCYFGSIKRFDKTQNYKIKVQAADPRQVIKLIVKEDASDNPQLNYFLRGQRETIIFPMLSYEPFVSTYNPSTKLDYISIYVCSENKEMPRIYSLSAGEIFSPSIVVAQKNSVKQDLTLPKVRYTKISPVKYDVDIEGVGSPFILVLNQRYDPLWKISAENYDHFVVDGYANAWKIDSDGKFIIEYLPQKFFYIGIVVSALTLICSLVVVGRNLKRK